MTLTRVLAVLTSCIPALALAASTDFVPIAPIPLASGELNSGTKLSDYVNGLFQFGIAVTAVVAVLQIVYGGYEYMLKDTIMAKADGRSRIVEAFKGIFILLSVYIVLYIINPDLVKLDLLDPKK